MSTFIVLGLIPGTNTQITFNLWLLLTSALSAALLARVVKQSPACRYTFVGLRLMLTLRRR